MRTSGVVAPATQAEPSPKAIRASAPRGAAIRIVVVTVFDFGSMRVTEPSD